MQPMSTGQSSVSILVKIKRMSSIVDIMKYLRNTDKGKISLCTASAIRSQEVWCKEERAGYSLRHPLLAKKSG